MTIFAIDAGGTKARFAAYDRQGVLLYGFERPSLHPLQVGTSKMAKGLGEGIETLMEMVGGRPSMVCFGLAGYGQNPKIRRSIEKALKEEMGNLPYVLHNDVECALMASLQKADGIMLVAGTGSIALRSLNHVKSRCGGWGYLVGDEGSGYWVGRKILGLFSKMADGRLAPSPLFDLVMDGLMLQEPSELIQHLSKHKNPKEATASLARLGYLACEKGDVQMMKVFEEAASELSLMVKNLRYDSPAAIPVKCTGGVFESGPYILNPLRKLLGPDYEVELSENPPLYGAYLFAKQALGD